MRNPGVGGNRSGWRSTAPTIGLALGLWLLGAIDEGVADQVSTELEIRAMVVPVLRYEILHQAAFLRIDKKDLGHREDHEKSKRAEHRTKHGDRDDDRRDDADEDAGSGHPERVGHKKVRNGTTIAVISNSPAGYVLVVQAQASAVYSSIRVKVKGAGSSLELAAGASVEIPIAHNGKKRDVRKLSYDFTLTPDIEPGSYPWPVYVTAYSM